IIPSKYLKKFLTIYSIGIYGKVCNFATAILSIESARKRKELAGIKIERGKRHKKRHSALFLTVRNFATFRIGQE
ncbi:MAG: hypothetical protein K2J03_02865, partial [Muribaculaceae bacterium]|nr:hypothetical protein [Muribaculaceae bacterium]